ncbi:MAG: hypothetical protein ACPL6D_03240, partial [Thermodesulfobacteriota bacterium]
MKKNLNRQNGIVILAILLTIGAMISPSYAEEERKMNWGFSLLAGPNADFIHGRPTLNQLAFLPRVNF